MYLRYSESCLHLKTSKKEDNVVSYFMETVQASLVQVPLRVINRVSPNSSVPGVYSFLRGVLGLEPGASRMPSAPFVTELSPRSPRDTLKFTT